MQLTKTLIILNFVPLLAVAGNQQDKQNKEQLTQVSRIYVAGEGPGIEKVRDRIGRAKGCFALAPTSTDSDAILSVGLPGEPGGGVALRAAADDVQGEVTTKDGSKIWATGAQVLNSLNRKTAVDLAIVSLINMLEKDAGCGKRKGALAKGQDNSGAAK